MSLHEGSEFINGQPKDTNLDAYRVLRMADVPELGVEFLPSAEAPVGLGEPATTGVAPAIRECDFRRLWRACTSPTNPTRYGLGGARAPNMTIAAAE